MIGLLGAIVISASLDANEVQLVEPTQLHIQVTQDAAEEVLWPEDGQFIPFTFEFEGPGRTDTTQLADGRLQIDRHLSIYSALDWIDTTYTIQPFVLAGNGDTVFSDPMQIRILYPEDIDKMEDIYDIKDIEEVPIWWWDVAKWGVLGIGVLIFGVLCYFGIMWYLIHYRPKKEAIDPILLRPADEVAYEKLAEIKENKKWQKGQVKEYQTELTDVIREYIGRRFGVQSAEKTSDETLRAVRPLLLNNDSLQTKADSRELYDRLKTMLQLADLVKFAKWTTTPDENERSLKTAYDFVEGTTIVETEKPKEESKEGKV